jgi:membrane-associated phospholipid phosphatase
LALAGFASGRFNQAVLTLERIWLGYCAAMIAVALIADGGDTRGHQPWLFIALHLGIAGMQGVIVLLACRWPPLRMRLLRGCFACIACPITFSSLAWLLPAVHPEPFEWFFLGLELRWFGEDLSQRGLLSLSPLSLLLLQCLYAAFYVLPVAAALIIARRGSVAAFDRSLTIIVGCFLISYLGYLLVPTLGPNQVYKLPPEAYGRGFPALLHQAIENSEANPWDCFPSGHTMLALVSTILVYRWARAFTLLMIVVTVPLIAATILLRYHWTADVLAGSLAALPAVWIIDYLLLCDGAPAA